MHQARGSHSGRRRNVTDGDLVVGENVSNPALPRVQNSVERGLGAVCREQYRQPLGCRQGGAGGVARPDGGRGDDPRRARFRRCTAAFRGRRRPPVPCTLRPRLQPGWWCCWGWAVAGTRRPGLGRRGGGALDRGRFARQPRAWSSTLPRPPFTHVPPSRILIDDCPR